MITQKTIDPGVINVMSLECDCLRIQKVKGQVTGLEMSQCLTMCVVSLTAHSTFTRRRNHMILIRLQHYLLIYLINITLNERGFSGV